MGKLVIFTKLCMKGDPFARFNGKISCKAYDFGIKVRNVQLNYVCSFKSTQMSEYYFS
jgi:hypothetical protein